MRISSMWLPPRCMFIEVSQAVFSLLAVPKAKKTAHVQLPYNPNHEKNQVQTLP